MKAVTRQAALENEQIDKGITAMGIALNLKEEENVLLARGGGSKSVQMGLAQHGRSSGGRLEDALFISRRVCGSGGNGTGLSTWSFLT